MDKDIVRQIIEAGNLAPSGGNSQPWKFKVTDNVVEVFGLPERDHPVLNFKNRGTLIALGALLENVQIKARSLGYEPRFEIREHEVYAKILLEPSNEKIPAELVEAIFSRHSNRKSYEKKQLSLEEKEYLFQEAKIFPECTALALEGDQVEKAAASVASDILIFLQNKTLHSLLFKEILWNEDDQKLRGGLYIRTMEAVPPKSLVFRLLGNWAIAKFFKRINFLQKIYQDTTGKAASSGLIGVILVENKDLDFVNAGRLLQNIWLRATKLGLSFQLVSGILFLWQQLHLGRREIFSEEETKIIDTAYEGLKTLVGPTDKLIALTFRIGKSEKPLAVSFKRPPEIEWL